MKFIRTIDEVTMEYDGGLINIDLVQEAMKLPNKTVNIVTLSGDSYAVKEKDFNEAIQPESSITPSIIRRLIESIDRLSVRIPSSIRIHP